MKHIKEKKELKINKVKIFDADDIISSVAKDGNQTVMEVKKGIQEIIDNAWETDKLQFSGFEEKQTIEEYLMFILTILSRNSVITNFKHEDFLTFLFENIKQFS